MNYQNYTSLELSKKLAEAGCGFESDYCWENIGTEHKMTGFDESHWCLEETENIIPTNDTIPAYDILNDICVKYAKEFFGDEAWYCYECREIIYDEEGCQNMKCTTDNAPLSAMQIYSFWIIELLQQNKKQEAEDYIWENCLFNKLTNK